MKVKRKRGRPPKYVLDSQGRPVVGLSYHKTNNFYFNTHWKTEGVKLINFGADRDETIFRFRQWESKRKGEESVSVDAKKISKGVRTEPVEFEAPQWLIDMQPTEEMKRQHREGPILAREIDTITIPESFIWEKARKLILNNSMDVVRKKLNLNIEIKGSVKPIKSISLVDVGTLYVEQPRFDKKSQRYRWEAKRYWKEFCKLVNAKTVRDITINVIDDYQETIYAKAKARKWKGGASINNRFLIVKTIFKNAVKRIKDVNQIPEIERVQGYLERLTYAEKTKVNPKPITKQDYLLTLKSESKPTYRAILLLALNCGMKQASLVAIKKEYVDLKNKTLQMPRPKTGIIRVACLWDRTCKAIKEMSEKVENKTDYLFLNELGKPLRRASINEWWVKRRRKLGINESVKFEHIRDATQTIPMEDDPKSLDEVRLIMGHAVAGIANSYLERRPNMVRKACRSIEQYYFSKK